MKGMNFNEVWVYTIVFNVNEANSEVFSDEKSALIAAIEDGIEHMKNEGASKNDIDNVKNELKNNHLNDALYLYTEWNDNEVNDFDMKRFVYIGKKTISSYTDNSITKCEEKRMPISENCKSSFITEVKCKQCRSTVFSNDEKCWNCGTTNPQG